MKLLHEDDVVDIRSSNNNISNLIDIVEDMDVSPLKKPEKSKAEELAVETPL